MGNVSYGASEQALLPPGDIVEAVAILQKYDLYSPHSRRQIEDFHKALQLYPTSVAKAAIKLYQIAVAYKALLEKCRVEAAEQLLDRLDRHPGHDVFVNYLRTLRAHHR